MGNGLAKVRALVGGGIGSGNSSGGNLKSHFGGMRKWKLAGMVMKLRAAAPELVVVVVVMVMGMEKWQLLFVVVVSVQGKTDSPKLRFPCACLMTHVELL